MPDKSSNVRLIDKEKLPGNVDERLIGGVEIVLDARLGSAAMTVAELMALKDGDCVSLDASLSSDVELRLNGVTIARGELVAVGDNFGVRIAEIARQ